MNVPKINAYIGNFKGGKTQKSDLYFRDWDTKAVDCFKTDEKELFNKYGAYKTLITYNEILAMKALAEKSKTKNCMPNLIVAFYPNSLGYNMYAMSQDDYGKGFDAMQDITDYDSF